MSDKMVYALRFALGEISQGRYIKSVEAHKFNLTFFSTN